MDPTLVWPDGFDAWAWEVEAKGWFDAVVEHDGVVFDVRFVDPVRLQQDLELDLASGPVVIQPNTVVVEAVDRATMVQAIRDLFAKEGTPLAPRPEGPAESPR